MARVQSEYEVESLFIERLTDMGYKFIPMKKLVKLTIVLAAIGAAAYHINKQFEALEITVAAKKRKPDGEPEEEPDEETAEKAAEATAEEKPEDEAKEETQGQE